MSTDSPVRPFRAPRFSTNGEISDENRPGVNVDAPVASFIRQFQSSPKKFEDRNVLLLTGNKVPSSVPGRRSSIGCPRERRVAAPVVIKVCEFVDDALNDVAEEQVGSKIRSKSLRDTAKAGRLRHQSLRRL